MTGIYLKFLCIIPVLMGTDEWYSHYQLYMRYCRDLQARGAQLAVQAPSDPQEDLDLRDHQELLERRECP